MIIIVIIIIIIIIIIIMAGSPPCFQLRCSNPTFGWAVLGARGPLGVQGEAGDALAEASFSPLLPSLRLLRPPCSFPLPSYSFLLPPGGSRTIPRGISLPVVFFSFSSFCLLPTSDLRHARWKVRLSHCYQLFRSMDYWSDPPNIDHSPIRGGLRSYVFVF